ncbi:hypothetical protein [Endozoicomonas sp.]|uniref:hypothetical protein n=1 Tax=Endozoicomonas sp. TaxID=1892382 RepID=UPI003AF8E5B3
MGKGSSSSSSSNTTHNTNSSIGVDGSNEGLLLSNVSGSTIEVTDKGAIDAAFTLAGETLELINQNQSDSYQAIEDNLAQSLAFVETQNLPDNGQSERLIKPIVYGSALVTLAYLALRR